MENLRNGIDEKLVSNKKNYLKRASKPSFMSHKIFDNDLVTIRKNSVILTLSKPAYTRMCILELTKVLTYEFHHDYVKNKYGNKSRLLFTDTDSLMYEIKTEDVYEDFSSDKEMVTISYKEYKDVLLNKKCLRHSMNRIQSKDHKIGTYEINKIF